MNDLPSVKSSIPYRHRIGARAFWRRVRLGLPTIFGMKPGGYFIPYRYAAGVPADTREPIDWIEALFDRATPDFLDLLSVAQSFEPELSRFRNAHPPLPRWEQSWFPRLDGIAAYSLARSRRPNRIVEIGSGHSTRFFSAGLSDGGAVGARIQAIDPAPRADIAQLDNVALESALAQTADPAVYSSLAPGDFLAIDSSHIAVPGSDVDTLLTRVLPNLPKGVLVQIHDIFLPDPYPETWAWRGYNEQGVVAALLAGGRWRPIWSSRYIATRLNDRLDSTSLVGIPLPEGAFESALWIEKL